MKNRYKLYEWSLIEKFKPMSMCIGGPEKYFELVGISDQRTEGWNVETSRVLNIDFSKGIAETRNSIYELQKIKWNER